MPKKKCTKCLKTKDLSEFHKQKSTKDGYKYMCKDCSAKIAINKVIKSKTCTKCKRDLPLEKFSKHKGNKDGLQYICKECYAKIRSQDPSKHVNLIKITKTKKEYDSDYYQANKITFKDNHLKRNYNISIRDYHVLLANQDNRCSICGQTLEESDISFAVDHNHNTGEVRGLLCRNCNTKLGWVEKVSIENILKYLNYNPKAKKSLNHLVKSLLFESEPKIKAASK